MRREFVLQYLALSGLGSVVVSAATLGIRQDNNAQIQQLQQQQQQQLQQEQQRNSASISSISSSFSSRLSSLSTSASSSISQLQTSLQSAQQAVNTLQQSLGSASRSVNSASQSAASAIASAQSSASSAEAALSLSLQSSMLASVSSAGEVMSISMSSAMVAAVASASASVSAAVVAAQALPPAAAKTADLSVATETASMSTVNGAASPAWQDPQSFTGRPPLPRQGGNALGACSTPEVVLAFAGIILGAVGVASLGCVLFLWCWRRRQERHRDRDAYNAGFDDKDAKFPGLSGETRSGETSRQWRIRSSTTQPKIYDAGVALQPEMPTRKTSKSSDEITENTETTVAATPEPTALSTNDRVLSTWSFSTAGGRDSTMAQKVVPLNIWGKQKKPARMSRNFSRGSRAMGLPKTQTPAEKQAQTKTRPASSVYEPFSQTARAVLRGVGITYNGGSNDTKLTGLERISRMEEEWNRSQQQRIAAASAKRGPTYTSNYAFYSNSNDKSKTTTSRHVSQDSADSLAREYHAFVSEIAPVSQYGTPLLRDEEGVPQLPRNGGQRPNIGGFDIRPYNTPGLI